MLLAVLLLASVGGAASAAPPPEGFADLAAAVTASVVNIEVTLKVAAPDDDRVPDQSMALGSGFIIDPAGYVVTNGHVTTQAAHIAVELADGRRFTARIVGTDDETDLALLKIDPPAPLPFATWGDSKAMRVGDWVLAIGNPLGLGGTVTAGIVSALDREVRGGRFDGYMQIDAPLGSGSSGGPAVNRRGEVIGINTAIFASGGASLGIGFTLPSAVARPALEELRRHGRVDWAWLGIELQNLSPEIADSLGLTSSDGALVIDVVPGAPAESAGMRQGDVIVTFDDSAVSTYRDLLARIAVAGPNKHVILGVWRAGRTIAVPVVLGIVPQDEPSADMAAPSGERPESSSSPRGFGLSLSRISPDDRDRFEIPEALDGALVRAVDPSGMATESGIQPGDVIVRAGTHRVTGARDIEVAASEAKEAARGAVLLLINRHGVDHFIGLALARE